MNKEEKLQQDLEIEFVKDLMKLPCNKETNTIRFGDINKLVERYCQKLVNKNPNVMETLEIMQDKELMKRFEQR